MSLCEPAFVEAAVVDFGGAFLGSSSLEPSVSE